ncbi:hypothetical protein [Pseudoalteromonas phenolica]|uniref:hypothetical protein n=1 Tax=Pseudoalteromonas phenolica TaxID=161398 RepID=UPI00148643F5|nr:hypothetical protein [Pseudoalteromonas phenolica]
MLIKLNKKKIKNLSQNERFLPLDQTPKVGGASPLETIERPIIKNSRNGDGCHSVYCK